MLRYGDWVEQHRLCATCWGPITQRVKAGELVVECARFGDRHAGNVGKTWVANQLAQSRLERMEVRESYRGVFNFDDCGLGRAAASREFYGRDDGGL